MPVIGIPVSALRARLGVDLEGDRLLRILGEIGCDVDGFARLLRTRCKKCSWVEERTATEEPPARCDRCNTDHRADSGTLEEMPDLEVVRMELLAVRPDMFDPGGLARSLRGYLGVETGPPEYPVGPEAARVRVDASVRDARSPRPHIACAVLENVTFDSDSIKILMKLQENLHWALGRNRKLASIGVYDFDAVSPEIVYTTEPPDSYGFTPLGVSDGTSSTLREILENHPKGRAYRNLLERHERYPVLRDANGRVLSMPPVINSEQTKVHEGSRRLFVDVTGMGSRIVNRALNILTTSLVESVPGIALRSVRIEGATAPDGVASETETLITPDLTPQIARLRVSATSRLVGIGLDAAQAVDLLGRMRHGARALDEETIEVRVPAYRNDILHERDLMEDLAIAYGYHNLNPALLPARNVGRAHPLEDVTERMRDVMCGLGFFETMTLLFSNDEESETALGLPVDARAVRLDNPITLEQTRMRTRLIPGLLQIFRHNQHQPLPQRIFEVGDVTWRDATVETGALEHRTVAFGVVGSKTGFTEARAIAEAITREFAVTPIWSADEAPPYVRGRCARLIREDGCAIGSVGEVHPEVLTRFGLENPAVLGELSVELLAGLPARTGFTLDG